MLLVAFASPVLTASTAGADSTDPSGYFTYTSNGTSITVTGCTSLCVDASVSIPSELEGLPVTSVTSGGFSGKHIVQLTIPNSVTTFNDIWQGGYNITEIVFAPGSKITRLRDFLFANNGNLRSIVMPDHLKEIAQYAFYNAGLDSVTIPGTVTSIEAQSFNANRFTSVTIPASVTSLSSSAFDGNVTKTFAPPAVSSVTYSLNGGSMPGGASLPTQADATQNTTFTVGNGTEPVKSGYLFGGWSDGSAAYADGSSYPMGGSPVTLSAVWLTVTWSYTISNNEVTVKGCTPSCPDAALTIPSTIKSLPVTTVNSANFSGVHIAQLTIPNSVTAVTGNWQGGYNITRIVFAPGSKITHITEFQFANNGNLRSIVLPDHLRSVGVYAFTNAGLDSITFPGTVTSLPSQSFTSNRFTTVTIPASVTSLAGDAFSGNVTKTFAPPAVSSVTYSLNGGSMPGGALLPTQADTTQNTTFTVGNGIEPVKAGYLFGGWSDGSASYPDGSSYSMGGSPVTLSALWLTVTWSYTINNGRVTVSGCTPSCPDAALTIPSTIEGLPVTSVTSGSFGSVHIPQLTIPNSVTTFDDIWQGGYNITRIVFAPGSKITRLRDFLFANNGNLRSIVMPDHLRQIGQYTFYNAGLDSVTIPGTVTSIEGESFRSNRFTSVTIPASVTSLASNAFDGNVTKTFTDPVVSSVTYSLNGGSMPGSASTPTQRDTLQNTTFTVGNGTEPVKAGYEFGGWSDYWGTIYDNGASFPMGGVAETLTAVWVTPTFSVTYNLDGGSGTLPTQSALESGATFQLPSSEGISFDGYTFLHWSDGSESYAPGETYTIGESDVTLTAVWSVNEAPVPDNVLPPGASESDLGEPVNITLGSSLDMTLTLGSNGTNASITVPAGALPSGTTLSVYPVLSSDAIAASLPAGQNYVVSLVVTWAAPDGSVPVAGQPLTMTISNAAIKAGDQVFQYLNGVLKLMGTATQDGTITFTFDEDPTFTVSTPTATDGGDGNGNGNGNGDGGSGGDGSGVSDGAADSSDGITNVVDATETASGVTLPYTGSNTNTPLGIALALFTLGGAMVLGTRRKKASLVRNDENELIS
jgi:LPXTG-motif cell wall-anchored protein